MKKCGYYLLALTMVGILLFAVLYHILCTESIVIDEYDSVDRPARIHPDCTDTMVPPNIAPLNFIVREEGTHYFVKIHSKEGEPIEVFSRSEKIMVPQKSWHKLLNTNKGEILFFDVFVKAENSRWIRFGTITNKIADEDIDGFLVYRKIYPVHSLWRDMGIYQRNLRNYDESILLHSSTFDYGCVNCHSFANNRPNNMSIGVRSSEYGSSAILIEDDTVQKVGAKFGYTSWHPSGRLAAFSINKVRQFYHSVRNEVRDVIDLDSVLAYYLVESGTVKTSPKFSRKECLESYPAWSADGRYLYFCSAPMLWSDRKKVPPERYTEVKYDLMRISYDLENDKWGQLETVLSAKDTGMSILEPRISPDGRWLLFCMCNYGSFPVYQKSSDLYLIDLKATEVGGQYKYRRLDINSDQSESWHSWSSNNRWVVFSSKREYGVFTRSYFSYVDRTGRFYKPLLLPQKDPAFYDFYLKTYSVPEFIVEPVPITAKQLGRVVRSSRKIPIEMPITMATPTAGSDYVDPWQERE
ncbi:MAG: TolB family protein [Planctomycetota bacterium]|jgi:hypothetical protein